MYIAAVILSLLLALAALGAGVPKVLLKGSVPEGLQQHMGLSAGLVRFIGLAEVSAAAGLVIGIFWQPVGIAAAIGLVALFIGAVAFHAKAGDYADPKTRGSAVVPIALGVIALLATVALALSL